MKNAGQNFLYLCKIYSTKFDLESNCNFLDEKRRPEVHISLQNFLNEIRFRIKLKHSEWKTKAKFPTSLQNFLNELRIRIKLQLSEWKRQVRNSFKLSSTKFDLESNWNILSETRRPEFPISLQNFLNEIQFGIKLKHSEWKTQAKISYIFAKVRQWNSI